MLAAPSEAGATSPATSRPICPCSRWPTCSGCQLRTGGCSIDWSNRVIGWQDTDYAVSATVRRVAVPRTWRARAIALRPEPGPDGRMPDPRTREGMPDLYAYARCSGERQAADPGDDIMSILMAQARRRRRRRPRSHRGVREPLLAVRRGRQRDPAQRRSPAGCSRCWGIRRRSGLRASRTAPRRGRGDAALVDAGHGVPPHPATDVDRARRPDPGRRQGRRVVLVGQPGRARLRRPDRFDVGRAPNAPALRPRSALLPRRPPRPGADARAVRRAAPPDRRAWIDGGAGAACGRTSSAA